MSMSIAIAVLAIALYLISGGRWTFALSLFVFLFVHSRRLKHKYHLESQNEITRRIDGLNSPIYAVDFTTSGPASKTLLNNKGRVKGTQGRRVPKIIRASKPINKQTDKREPVLTQSSVKLLEAQVFIFYTTLTGSSERVAKGLYEKLENIDDLKLKPKLLSLDEDVDDLEEYFLKTPGDSGKNIYLLVLPSYETDSPIDYFLEHLRETHNDFRVDKYPLSKLLGFAVLGLGDSESWGGDKFCYQAKLADKFLAKLGGRRLYPLGNVCMKFEGEPKSNEWIQNFAALMVDNEPFYITQNEEFEDSDYEEDDGSDGSDTLVDVEDIGSVIRKSASDELTNLTKQMVAENSPTFKSLTKQGYTIVGSHSGVKICRWTKSALRGRGSCYKFAFYGIRSHLCMETTPSLACSNKCVFCWRHGTNPVAKSNWRWELDPPEKVIEGALRGHYQKIKQMRGVPGIQLERFQEAFEVKHCALSLVGEPIFYPHINELVQMLHDRQISSFLVCNAQHPEQLRRLQRVTQLYVSIDAPTKVDLKKIDRPLNGDFWERLTSCLDILRTVQKHQRTVFRLTLVKGFNMGDVGGYADMVVRAQPSQIEVKGATFCGSSSGNGNPLTMQNIPFYEECKQFVLNLTHELKSRGFHYDIAAEHAHSCCILIAHEKFKIDGKWFTHIDYPKFFELLKSGKEFIDLDYIKETPAWAVWGSNEAGFNPEDVKYDRKAEKLKKRQQREEQLQIIAEHKEVL
ncbi:uncharacterized protein PRCAT00000158001 [Priceomyces carsonii]|uniref:uncharacterized protein n=1 Tax=Priceomyces carsonii TaxID=28549 RepID=UPI002ED79A5A|nr:unnamed protein product [Priceomyces carsonii]